MYLMNENIVCLNINTCSPVFLLISAILVTTCLIIFNFSVISKKNIIRVRIYIILYFFFNFLYFYILFLEQSKNSTVYIRMVTEVYKNI